MVKTRIRKKTDSSTANIEEASTEQVLQALQEWKDKTEVIDHANLLKALRAYRNGNFSVRMPETQVGIAGEIARAFNECVELNQIILKEFERVSKAVGREGKLSQRVSVSAAKGGWANTVMAYNATVEGMAEPVGEFGRVVAAIAKGDLTEPMSLEIEGRPLRGEFLRVAKTTNQMIELLNNFSSEVTRVALEVGTDGILGGQAKIRGVSGVWLDLTNSVNGMANNLTNQVRNIATVATAVANGDLSQRITVQASGEVLELKETLNRMVERLTLFSSEVTRVSREVGTDGKLGGNAEVRDVAGVWQELTNNVNGMADNLTNQVRNIATVATAVANGDLTQKITVDAQGEVLELKNTINTMVDRLTQFASEVTRVAREVGTDGQLGGKAKVPGVAGVWQELTNNVNGMADNLTSQVRNIATVATAVANGDLSQKITVEAKGEVLELKDTINRMVDSLTQFSSEVTRVAKEVGTDGKLGGKAEVKEVAGVWRDLTNNVNGMADNLTNQVRNIATVATAVANGDLTQKITVDAQGEVLELKNTINTMVDSLTQFSSEVTRVAREVGTDGKLGGNAEVRQVAGVWQDLTNNVNNMANNLTNQVRNIATVATTVANGDLSQRITVEASGEVLDLKNTINTMVDRLTQFSSEVTRVAQEVGTEGKLGGKAEVPDVAGVWQDLTNNVNGMADNLTNQVRNIATVATAVANGDLTQKITVEARGEVLELKNTINTMVDSLTQFSSEVTRVAREVGTEGKLGGKAYVRDVGGVWRELTNNVNGMADNLTNQVRNIATVATAVANGDLTQKITVEARGEVLELKNTINTMVERLTQFSSEVTRVAQEVGTEGVLGGKANVEDVAGVWQDLTNNVNGMADNLTNQVRNIATVATAVANGDLAQKITVDAKGEILELKNTINTMVDKLTQFASEVTRVAQEVGTEGKLGGKAVVRGVSGAWQELTDNVNGMADNLTNQVRNIATVATAVANGDLSQKITVNARGEILELKNTINTMVDKLTQFASEVTRVAQEVGTEGKLGVQAEVSGVTGAWGDLTLNVNKLAKNLTDQVRDIARVAAAVARGDLEQKITVEAQGEVLALKETINSMIDILSLFANQVTFVAKEVGTEGKLGGQADVPNAKGIWKDLTENVNELADNLTRQIRSILTVVTEVTKGNLTGSIDVAARGEVETLKNGLNQMILTLKETSDINIEQDWLKTNLSKFGQLMQGNKSLQSLAEVVIRELCPTVAAQHGVYYILDQGTDDSPKKPELALLASYAYHERKAMANVFEVGQSLVGQAAREKKRIIVHQVPNDYIKICSGLGESKPLHVIELPVLFENELLAVIELASFEPFSEVVLNFLDQLMTSLGVVANAVNASSQTESLLRASQSLSQELQAQQQELKETNEKLEAQARNLKESETKLKSQQEELQQTNEELEQKSQVLAEQKREVEKKNREVEEAKAQIEEKAQQLALSSKYKSEFLANMSHELRTPLNSLMVLSDGLRKNIDKNLTNKQIEKMNTIHDSGIELLELINEILDLAKIEAGKMSVQISDIFLHRIQNWAVRGFQQMAENKGLEFNTEIDSSLPAAIQTDEKRLQQVIKNFLSNAIKFTNKGQVNFIIHPANSGWSDHIHTLNEAKMVIAFSVADTGIGIAPDKTQLIFEAFQQADGTTSRRFGGTGLGLSISREISTLLGGEIVLKSEVGKGSTFTLFLPQVYPGAPHLSDSTEKWQVVDESKKQNLPLFETTVFDKTTSQTVIEHTLTEIEDDRTYLKPGDRTVLIIEDDHHFARILLEHAREKGFKGIVASRGDAGLFCAQEYRPDAIILDIKLPIMNGWTVLDRIKHDPKIRHIPVHVVSIDDVTQRSLKQGAISCLQKPLDDGRLKDVFDQIVEFQQLKEKQLLVIEDDEKQRSAIIDLIGNGDVKVTAVASAEEGLAALNEKKFHCMVLDLILPDMSGFELIENIKQQETLVNLPIIVYTGKEITPEEETRLCSVAETIIVKNVKSPERLLDETALFLHRIEANLPESKRQMLQQVHENDPQLAGRKILVVDDDVRNIFTLTSIFEAHDSITLYAESGKQAIDVLKNHPDIEIILMDIMMPEMDGYETMKAIRKISQFSDIPMIAVTAKAMKEDRQKCMDAGASDYIVKPIDTEQLLSLVRVWLYKEQS
ncbi:HAMP domain-containing protein [Spartinivicinus poritis]|uniref:histidine kinase n=1 Tax=Spartinivicinus poritis TaxID=2994640 RepID=A0ABT5U2Q4_9GAMM|nr:HAMP domain-containing protein [Spartinivicinus sp. A2-2]MDE1460641.1 HAMP domain-containing protein [Spartinivicinus sp. A2-2]